MILAGALPAALLAIIVDTILAGVEKGLTSEGLKIGSDEFAR